ncbi:MAG: hypothetical protein M4579_006055 [Chaenotheca gracillima]|nr:MAG: hypothetical protein M4579_006055 [Chaenotheca gracillima]
MPAPAPTPEFLAQNRGPTLITVGWIFTSLSILVVALRLFTRFRLTRNAGWDDHFITFGLFLSVASTAIATSAAVAGCGKHLVALSPEQQTQAIKLNAISEPFGIMSYCIPKISVALLIKRIMPPNKLNKWQMQFIYFITISLTVLSILCAIFLFVQCLPASSLWDPVAAEGAKCWDPNVLTNFTIFTGAYSAFCDLYLAIFPITIFWNLQMNMRTKVGLCVVMGLGIVASVCSIIKTTKLKGLGAHSDFTWETVYLVTWTIIEANVIIIAACIPTLRPMMLWILGRSPVPTHKTNTKREGYYAFDDNEPTLKSSTNANASVTHPNTSRTPTLDDKSRQFSSDSDVERGTGGGLPLNNITRTVEIQTAWEHV